MDIFSLPTQQPKRNVTIISLIVAAIMTLLFVIFFALYIHKNKEYNEVATGLQEISRISGSQSSTIDDLVNESENLQYKIRRLVDIADERGETIDELESRVSELEDIIERAKMEMGTLVMHWNWEEDSWTISNDINNVSFVLNEY